MNKLDRQIAMKRAIKPYREIHNAIILILNVLTYNHELFYYLHHLHASFGAPDKGFQPRHVSVHGSSKEQGHDQKNFQDSQHYTNHSRAWTLSAEMILVVKITPAAKCIANILANAATTSNSAAPPTGKRIPVMLIMLKHPNSPS